MIRGIYTATTGLHTIALRLGIVSNNVANASTPGYKQDRLPEEVGLGLDLVRLAAGLRGQPLGGLGLGPRAGQSQLDLGQGPMQETTNPLDLAVGGNGFFATRDAQGVTRYTRDGGFHLDPDGALLARDGAAVLDSAGQPIRLNAGMVQVAADGSMIVDGAAVAQLQVVEFAPGQELQKVGNGAFLATAGAVPQQSQTSQIYQGYLEGSNVDLSESMVNAMSLVRAYAANQRMLQVQDETLGRAVNEIGKV